MVSRTSDNPVGWAIVAIPEEDDFVWKISSVKVPHLTLLYLGDQNAPETEAPISSYLQHVADTSMTRFGLSVDRRGELGPDQADVLFFDDSYGIKGENGLAAVRESILKNHQVLDAYNSTTQYPNWTPHLTLGFPDTPAKPDDRDYPGIHWVNFDRIALWTGDFSGPTFDLKRDHSMAMSEWSSYDRAMVALTAKLNIKPADAVHFGRRGMKWGVVHPRGANGRVNIEGRPTRATRKALRKSGVHTLSDEELKKLTDRINLETNYAEAVSRGSKVKAVNTKAKLALDLGKTANDAIQFGNSAVGQLILLKVNPKLASNVEKIAGLSTAAKKVAAKEARKAAEDARKASEKAKKSSD